MTRDSFVSHIYFTCIICQMYVGGRALKKTFVSPKRFQYLFGDGLKILCTVFSPSPLKYFLHGLFPLPSKHFFAVCSSSPNYFWRPVPPPPNYLLCGLFPLPPTTFCAVPCFNFFCRFSEFFLRLLCKDITNSKFRRTPISRQLR